MNGNLSGYALATPENTSGVPDAGHPGFGLKLVSPNPSPRGTLKVELALPSGDPARLALMDVGGRVIAEREVGSLGAGRHILDLTTGRRLAAGIYWMRLTQGLDARTARVTILQ